MDKIPLADDMFENMVLNSSDKDLNEAAAALRKYHKDNPRQFQHLVNVPFIQNLFALVDSEYLYRNQTMEEFTKNVD